VWLGDVRKANVSVGMGMDDPAAAGEASAASSGVAGTAGDGTRVPSGPPAAFSGGAPARPRVPLPSRACPPLVTGLATIRGASVQLWAGEFVPGRVGPLLVYWHDAGGSGSDAESLTAGALDDIVANGGIVAALVSTTGTGLITGHGTWYVDDLDVADDIVACAALQRTIDVARVYTAGCGMGGVQAAAMALLRSEYVTAAMLNSGGSLVAYRSVDPDHVPAIIAAHGPLGTDVADSVDFATATQTLVDNVAAQGGLAVSCAHERGHCDADRDLLAAEWQFVRAHSYGVKPSPFAAGLPHEFPANCQTVRR
jgi:hypothetical protein